MRPDQRRRHEEIDMAEKKRAEFDALLTVSSALENGRVATRNLNKINELIDDCVRKATHDEDFKTLPELVESDSLEKRQLRDLPVP